MSHARLDRLALPALLRLRRVLRLARRLRRARALGDRADGADPEPAPVLRRRHAHPGHRVPLRRRRGPAHRLHASLVRAHGRRPAGGRARRRRPDGDGPRAALRVRPQSPLGGAGEGRHRSSSPAPTRSGCARDAPFAVREGSVVSQLTVNRGQRFAFQLGWHASHLPEPPALDPWQELSRTRAYWSDWAGRCTYQGRYREPVMRSLLTLKALTYAPDGGDRRRADRRPARGARRRAQLGLPLLLAARHRAHAPFADAQRLCRGGDELPRLAGPRGGGRSGTAPDHVRHPRRPATDRVRAPVAAGLRRLPTGPRRQRRVRAAAARHLRRDHELHLRGPEAGNARAPARLSHRARDGAEPRAPLAAARRGHLGGPRRTPSLHLLEGDGLGRRSIARSAWSRSSAAAGRRRSRPCPS